MRDQVLEILHAVAVRFVRHAVRDNARVFSAEADTREMALAAGPAALSEADDQGRDVEKILQRELERRHDHAGTGVSDDGALSVDVERRQRLGYLALLFRRAARVH